MAQAGATRQRILDAIPGLLRDHPGQVSMAGIARAARVSLPTVHRHFPTRQALFEAYRLRVEGGPASRQPDPGMETTNAGMAPALRAFFKRFDDPKDPIGGMRRLRASLAWEFSRQVTVPRRQQWAAEIVATRCPTVGAADRRRLSDLLVVLVSASMGEALAGYLNLSGDEMADRVIWATDALVAHAVARAPNASGRRTRR